MPTKSAIKKSFNNLVREKAIEDLQLSRLESAIFYRLCGLLLKQDSVTYTVEKLMKNTLYKRRAIFEGLNSLETKQLIAREGFSYRRRFYKGKVLHEICSHVQKLHGIELNTSAESALYSAKNASYSAKTAYNKTLKEPLKQIKTVFEKLKIQPQKSQWPTPTEEQKDLLLRYKHGLKYPELQLEGFELQKAAILYKRYNSC